MIFSVAYFAFFFVSFSLATGFFSTAFFTFFSSTTCFSSTASFVSFAAFFVVFSAFASDLVIFFARF
jgi:hypothetical protein